MAQQPTAVEPVAPHWSSCVWPQLPPELAERIVGCLDRSEIFASFRRVNKATARHFRGPQHTRVRLSEPVPPHAFAAHWLAPGATRDLNLERRRQLVRLVAASGVQANLEVALQAAGFVGAVAEAFEAAAGAGHLPLCQWLQDYSRNRPDYYWAPCKDHVAFLAAANKGHRHVCEWVPPPEDREPSDAAIVAAARGGLADLALRLLRSSRSITVDNEYLCGVAHGCNLAVLQRAWQRLGNRKPHCLISAAAGSPTPDWAAKVEYLEACGCPRSAMAVATAAALPDDGQALARVTWLRARGYPLEPDALWAAARRGNTAALQVLLAEAPADLVRPVPPSAVHSVAMGGHLAALQALHAAGCPIHWKLYEAAFGAAVGGHLHVLAWVLDEPWPEEDRPLLLERPDLFALAARSGSVELMAWLRGRGCPLDGDAFPEAVKAGCAAALEWLVGQGCPIEEDGHPYVVACANNGDLATVRCLARLGVPWGPTGRVFLDAATKGRPDNHIPTSLPLLRSLLEAGCPVDLTALAGSVADWRERIWPLRDYQVLGLVVDHVYGSGPAQCPAGKDP
ncbi:hypothetical protein GPECTOR_7g946 [Gonium pectorale]|uniref:F-box domain-containing protein n=1 Tax=Gonium pectorale TaxID=33097 RepID=A0A150GUE5_GONPE|nr:hypothetical protein GPECTOR_7g946 [Gonium pectorale]|eukprot:KXZ53496.1 hypothetical protein GPECTOR_7g946 [Gonium pectorale]